ncbi:MAG TPA: hypothetical protein PKZ76_12610 [Xanthomonadaceae bacterium]|nr:hypothetical protein [Xanthomonadaceae bacterium]
MTRSDSRLLLFALLASASLTVTAQVNLVPNGGFATDLGGWAPSGEGTAVWSDVDIDDDTGSGSALLGNAEATAGQRVYPLEACIVLGETGLHRIGASGMGLSGAASGRLVFSYSLRHAADCTGGASAIGGLFLNSIDTWQSVELSATAFSLPATIELRLGIEKDPAGGSFHGHFDDVYVIKDALIFANGFE